MESTFRGKSHLSLLSTWAEKLPGHTRPRSEVFRHQWPSTVLWEMILSFSYSLFPSPDLLSHWEMVVVPDTKETKKEIVIGSEDQDTEIKQS